MNFLDAMKAVKFGWGVRRESWNPNLYAGMDDDGLYFRSGPKEDSVTFGSCFKLDDYLATDWTLVRV